MKSFTVLELLQQQQQKQQQALDGNADDEQQQSYNSAFTTVPLHMIKSNTPCVAVMSSTVDAAVDTSRTPCGSKENKRPNSDGSSIDWNHNSNYNSKNDDPFLLQPGDINELSGPAGSGKTQLALTLCMECVTKSATHQPNQTAATTIASSSVSAASTPVAVYLCSSSGTSGSRGGGGTVSTLARRLQQMIQQNHRCDEQERRAILNQVLFKPCANTDDILDFLRCCPEVKDTKEGNTPASTAKSTSIPNNCGVLIIDSIADFFRCSTISPSQRAPLLFEISARLRALSKPSSSAAPVILILNQITASINDTTSEMPSSSSFSSSHSNHWSPALGLAWGHCVTARYRVTASNSIIDQQQQQQQQNCNDTDNKMKSSTKSTRQHQRIRTVTVIHSPKHRTPTSTNFLISLSGCVESPEIS